MENLSQGNLELPRKNLNAYFQKSPKLLELSQPLANPESQISREDKIRRLYLQASMEQWFMPDRVNFDLAVHHEPQVIEVWLKYLEVFYTLEKMGLRTIQRMTPHACHQFKSNEVASYLAVQAHDEARHVFCVENYMRLMDGPPTPHPRLEAFEKISSMGWLRVENWLFSTLFSESVASAFIKQVKASPQADPILLDIAQSILRDESRHLHFLNLILPDVLASMGAFKRTYVKASQYFLMKLTDWFLSLYQNDCEMLSISPRALIEESFENVERTYEILGVTRDFLWFPKISPSLR